jgi:hypothetical protein
MGGHRKPVEAAILKGLGATAGVPDVLLWHAGKSYAIELKSEDGRLSEAQAEMLRRLADAGTITAVSHGIDRAVRQLEDWALLRGHASGTGEVR